MAFEADTALRSTAAAKKAGEWYRGVLDDANLYRVRWHEGEAQLSRKLRASAVGWCPREWGQAGATRGIEGKPTEDMGGGGVEGNSRWTDARIRRQTG